MQALRPSRGTRQDRVDRPGAGGERLGGLEAWRGGWALHAGFDGTTTKPSGGGFPWFGPQNQMPRAQRDGEELRVRSGSFEAGTRGVIARLASGRSKVAVHGRPPDGNIRYVTKLALHGCVSSSS